MIGKLPALNATLNLLSTLFLLSGYLMIRRRRVAWHRRLMISAFVSSCLFLTSYLVYHLHAGRRLFTGTGAVRTVYLAILASHTLLAAVIPFLAVITLLLGLWARHERHRRLARWTLPLWLYVSLTGVVIYVMLYHI
jgi:uncharacterized membrane protein YozB (DUF420 family)